jgi:hypothetical protein
LGPQSIGSWKDPTDLRVFIFGLTFLAKCAIIQHRQQKGAKMFSTAKNTIAKAKLVKSKIPELYKLVVAFNVTEITKNGSYKFPVQAKYNYVS